MTVKTMPQPIPIDATDPSLYEVQTHADGPAGTLPLDPDFLRNAPSGDIFALSQNAGMGWTASEVDRDPYLVLSTQGGLRAPDGAPIALGYHTGHWEIGLLVQEAAFELSYQLQVAPWWIVQPDLQYIIHPGGNVPDPGRPNAPVKNAFVAGLRSAVKF